MNRNFTNVQKFFALALLCAIALTGLPIFTEKVLASGTITGRVFQDFNGNGTYDTVGSAALPAIDAGIAGVTVTAFDSAGVVQNTATTVAVGTYSLATTGVGPYRLEFTTLPAGFSASARSTDSVSGGTAADSGSTVQFVPDGSTSDVNLAVNRPNDYSQNDPRIVVPVYINGNPLGGGTTGTQNALVGFPYSYSGTTAPTYTTNGTVVGATWGQAYQKVTKKLFSSAVVKRHVGLGTFSTDGSNGTGSLDQTGGKNSGTGGIYVTDFSVGSPTPAQFVDLQSLGITTGNFTSVRGLSASATTPNTDAVTFALAGKMGIGDIDLSVDGNTLWAVNLNNRSLVKMDVTNGAVPTSALEFSIPSLSGAPTCTGGLLRPWALAFKNDKGYVGTICTAETSGLSTNLNAFVLSFNPANPAGGLTTELTIPLNYTKGMATDRVTGSNVWFPWLDTYSDAAFRPGTVNDCCTQTIVSRPTPILSDIEFGSNGGMFIGFTDRAGNQLGNGQPRPDGTGSLGPASGGELLRACLSGSTYILESNGSCGTFVGSGVANNQGPGSGEFFANDSFNAPNHNETAQGGLALMQGANLLTTIMDPQDYGSGGIGWMNRGNGASPQKYQVFTFTLPGGQAKSNGLGDIELLADTAPIEIGNRVWNDANGNGVQDAGELPIAGVAVHLYNAANVLIATAVTNAEGEYYFTSGTTVDPTLIDNIGIVNGQITPNTNYQVRFDNPVDYTSGNPLNGRFLTIANQTTQNGFDEGSDSDASNVTNPAGSPSGTFPVILVTTGVAGDNNHNLDVGFAGFSGYSIGNRVWYDTNDNGQIDAAEVGISGISVSLFADANGDGIPDTVGSPLQTLTTDANGYYRFDGLAAGGYLVRVNPANFSGTLNGYKNTTGNVTTDTDSDVTNAGENGINPTGALNSVNSNGILSNTITLGPGASEPTGETDVATSGIYTGQGSIDNQADMTVDFGFYEICLCGTIWQDNGAGGGGNNNGIQDGTEAGIASLRVRVYSSAGVEIPVGDDGDLGTADDALGGTLTDSSGVYHFRGLLPGDYRIAIAPANSSTPTDSTPNDNIDSDDNGYINPSPLGSIATGWIVSHPITLTAGGEPLVNNADGTTANVTLDMGIIAAPSAVQMNEFAVYVEGNKAVVTWTTGTEINNLGFNVYREVGGERTLLTKTPIVGSAFRSAELRASGESYQFTDDNYTKEAVYLVEDLDLNGNSTMHSGPAASETSLARFGVVNSKSLADLSEASNDARFESESVESKSAKALKTNVKSTFNAKTAQAKQLEIAQLGGLKVDVNRDGWYRLSAAQLAIGNLTGDSTNWQLYANGQEVSMRVNVDNSVEFYGQSVDLRSTDSQAYYIIKGKNAGLRLETVDDSGDSQSTQANEFTAVAERKERTVYAPYLLNGDKENWFGPSVYTNNQTVQTVNVAGLADGITKLSVKLQGYTSNQHSVRIWFNDTDLSTVEFHSLDNKLAEFNLPANLVREGANQVKLTALNTTDVSLVESVKISYPKHYKAVNNQLRFTVAANLGVSVGGFNDENMNVFELENGQAVRKISPKITKTDGEYGFLLSAENRDREFVALTNEHANAVANVEQNTPSNLVSTANGTNFVIIAPKFLAAKAEQLAVARGAQGIRTQVVQIEDVYDEFSYGLHDGQAIKNFLQYATSSWTVKPDFVLLFGDSSADSKGYLNGSSRDFVPTKLTDTSYMETASDSSLADFNDDDIEDIAIGRLPAATEAEADSMLAKLARFDAQGTRRVKKNVLVADTEFASLSDQIANQLPAGITTVKLNRADIGDANMRSQIVANANDNPLVVSYFGHGNTSNWTNAGVFNKTDALSLSNDKLSFYLLMTCLNGYTHSPYADSLAESLLKSNGGAIAVLASPNLNLVEGQQTLRASIYRLMFNVSIKGSKSLRFGVIIKTAKSATQDRDVRKSYMLIGDPTLVVK
jgi:Peptidase family C25/SdrD B-like domain